MDILVVALKRDELVLASFRARKGGVSFLSAERHQLDGTPDELPRILTNAAQAGVERRVVLAVPPAHLFMRELELPLTDRAKVRELLPLELKGEIALDTDALSFDALALADGKFLAVWGRNQYLAGQIELLKEAGLEPEVVTASLFHWDNLAPAAGTVAVTDGEGLAVYRDVKPLFFRALPPGSGPEEISRTIAALELSQGVRVDRVISYTHGTGSAESLALAPRTFVEAFAGDAHSAHDLAGAYAVAAALAHHSALNLRRGELAYTAGDQRLHRKLRFTMALAALVAVLFFAESGVRYALAKRDVTSLDQSIRSVYKQIFPTRKKPVDEVAEVRAEIRKLEGTRTSSDVLRLLKDVAQVKGEDVSGIYEAEIDKSDVRLKGEARSIQAANDFKTRAAKIFDGAEVSEIKSKPDGSVSFTFHGTTKGGSQ